LFVIAGGDIVVDKRPPLVSGIESIGCLWSNVVLSTKSVVLPRSKVAMPCGV